MRRVLLSLVLLTALFAVPASASSFEEIAGFMAFPPDFAGGVQVAICGPDASGIVYVVTGPGPSLQPDHVAVEPSVGITTIPASPGFPTQFLAYDRGFLGGVSVSCAVEDNTLWITTGALAGGGPHVRVWRLTVP